MTAYHPSDACAPDVALLLDGALPVPAAVREFGVGRTALYEAMNRGELAYVRRGDRRLIPRRALAAWLATTLVPATAIPEAV